MCGLKIKTRETITVKLANSYLDFLCCENLNITPSNQLSVEFFSLHTNEIKMAVVVELDTFLSPCYYHTCLLKVNVPVCGGAVGWGDVECVDGSDTIHTGNSEERRSCWLPNTSVGDS